jgi:hypothetical protein
MFNGKKVSRAGKEIGMIYSYHNIRTIRSQTLIDTELREHRREPFSLLPFRLLKLGPLA